MHRIDRNNFHTKPKNSTIYTPKEVSEFIFELLKDKLNPLHQLIYDPCVGTGSLLVPWKNAGYDVWGNDIDPSLFQQGLTNSNYDFLNITFNWSNSPYFQPGTVRIKGYPKLVICNPPFNGYGKQLGSEVWLDKIIELFGKDIPTVLFVPAGFCLNLTLESKRHAKFENGIYPPISSQITLPKNIFPNVLFRSEILIFNLKWLEPHYFCRENKYE